jgi:hypothetical protein
MKLQRDYHFDICCIGSTGHSLSDCARLSFLRIVATWNDEKLDSPQDLNVLPRLSISEHGV